MNLNRREVNIALLASALFSAGPPLRGQADQTKAGTALAVSRRRPYFFQNPTFEMIFLTSLGRAYHSGGDVAKAYKEHFDARGGMQLGVLGDVRQPEVNLRCYGFVSYLDEIIRRANMFSFFGLDYKPYWMLNDLATASAFIYAFLFAWRFSEVSGWALSVAVIGALLAYKFVRELKGRLGLKTARSFLQDCLMVIIPSFLMITWMLGQPRGLSLAFIGTLMPLYGSFARIGCFLGGCCYGKPSHIGVLYPTSLFVSTPKGCRRYSPSADPKSRVFPIQLAEAGVQILLFIFLAVLLWHRPNMSGSIFWLYLSLYAFSRFFLDFYRTASACPRRWGLSQAQLVCIAVNTVSLTVICFS